MVTTAMAMTIDDAGGVIIRHEQDRQIWDPIIKLTVFGIIVMLGIKSCAIYLELFETVAVIVSHNGPCDI